MPRGCADDYECRVLGMLLGAVVGDALGSVFEGAVASREFRGRVRWRAAAAKYWRYTDDAEMALAVASSLVEVGPLDQEHLVRTLAQQMDLARG